MKLRSIACRLVLGDSIHPCTIGSRSFTGLQVGRHWTNRRPRLNSVSHRLYRIRHDMKYVIRCFLMTKPDAGSTPSLPASDPSSAATWGSKRINHWPKSCLCLTQNWWPFMLRQQLFLVFTLVNLFWWTVKVQL